MRLVLDNDPRIHLVRSYADGVIVIDDQSITGPCIVSPQQLRLDWDASSIAGLNVAQLQPLLALNPSIILLGAGSTHEFASAELRALCRGRSIALECMNLGAACRTYNVLASEQRSVVAGLFP